MGYTASDDKRQHASHSSQVDFIENHRRSVIGNFIDSGA